MTKLTIMKRNKVLHWYVLLILFTSCSTKPREPHEIKNGDVQIAYTKQGDNDTAIVFVHGWCINKEYWKDQIDAFSKRYTVVAVDLGGHGESGKNRHSWTVQDFANDVIAVIDGFHLNKVILVGHSMGGDIILETANKIPEKVIGFIGIDNFKDVTAGFSEEQKREIGSFMDTLQKNYLGVAVSFSRQTLFPPNYKDTVSVNRVLHDIEEADSTVAIESIKSVLEYTPKEPENLSRLQVPLYLIESDYTPVAEDSLKKYCTSGYFIRTVHGTGHYPMIEKPQEFNTLLGETLDDMQKRKR